MAEVSARRAHSITMEEHILAVTSTLNTSSCFVRLSTRCMSLTESSHNSPWNVSARYRVRKPNNSGDERRKRANQWRWPCTIEKSVERLCKWRRIGWRHYGTGRRLWQYSSWYGLAPTEAISCHLFYSFNLLAPPPLPGGLFQLPNPTLRFSSC